jgi:lipoprotein-anchoring transpeptidase ErfK/SrfK
MTVSRRSLIMTALAAGAVAGCKSSGQDLLGEAYPVFESDAEKIPPEFRRTLVDYQTSEKPGAVIVDTNQRYLYHVEEGGKATRYGVGVGKEGRTWYGEAVIGRKEKWPVWTPTPEHIAEHPYIVKYSKGMPGGKGNPMGARALYLYQGDIDTVIRIHGAYKPDLIGKRSTAGCISMINPDVVHLYDRVNLGTRVVILPAEV